MKIIISPAKKLDFDTKSSCLEHSTAHFLRDSQQLINTIKKFSEEDIAQLMSISPKLAKLNVERFNHWKIPFKSSEVKQAIFAFQGDVYKSMGPENFDIKELNFAQSNIRILSGLYGILKPFDLIMPYRLEMGTKLNNSRGKNLYEFWGDILTKTLKNEMTENEILVNLASDEYSKSIDLKVFNDRVVHPVFKDTKNGDLKVISFFAKKARGYMCKFIVENKLTYAEQLLDFNLAGYKYSEKESKKNFPTFIR
ncbi:MAG: peroxide stress protein YaaA [Bacteroidota bacterium]|nr:peroxide stress protein YaaA [Bacteroidota bacterium]